MRLRPQLLARRDAFSVATPRCLAVPTERAALNPSLASIDRRAPNFHAQRAPVASRKPPPDARRCRLYSSADATASAMRRSTCYRFVMLLYPQQPVAASSSSSAVGSPDDATATAVLSHVDARDERRLVACGVSSLFARRFTRRRCGALILTAQPAWSLLALRAAAHARMSVHARLRPATIRACRSPPCFATHIATRRPRSPLFRPFASQPLCALCLDLDDAHAVDFTRSAAPCSPRDELISDANEPRLPRDDQDTRL
jgi:hypothetical protein